MEKEIRKFYIVGPSSGGEGIYSLLADDGAFLASHFCSHAGYALGDLERNRPERKKEWKEKYGDYEVLMLGDDEMTKEEILRRNKEWYDNLPAEEKREEDR